MNNVVKLLPAPGADRANPRRDVGAGDAGGPRNAVYGDGSPVLTDLGP